MNDTSPTLLSTKQIHASIVRELSPHDGDRVSRHLDPLAGAFIRAVRHDLSAGSLHIAAVSVPPRFGVSTLLRHAMASAIIADPRLRIGYVTYSQTVATNVSRGCAKVVQTTPSCPEGWSLNVAGRAWLDARRAALATPGAEVPPQPADGTWARDWSTAAGGGVHACGVLGAFLAQAFDLLVIDAPFKNMLEGTNPKHQEAVFSWFMDEALCRVLPGGGVILAGPRMARGDLHGRMFDDLTVESTRIPAIREGRSVWPEGAGLDKLDAIKGEIGEEAFAALYQGQPRA